MADNIAFHFALAFISELHIKEKFQNNFSILTRGKEEEQQQEGINIAHFKTLKIELHIKKK